MGGILTTLGGISVILVIGTVDRRDKAGGRTGHGKVRMCACVREVPYDNDTCCKCRVCTAFHLSIIHSQR